VLRRAEAAGRPSRRLACVDDLTMASPVVDCRPLAASGLICQPVACQGFALLALCGSGLTKVVQSASLIGFVVFHILRDFGKCQAPFLLCACQACKFVRRCSKPLNTLGNFWCLIHSIAGVIWAYPVYLLRQLLFVSSTQHANIFRVDALFASLIPTSTAKPLFCLNLAYIY